MVTLNRRILLLVVASLLAVVMVIPSVSAQGGGSQPPPEPPPDDEPPPPPPPGGGGLPFVPLVPSGGGSGNNDGGGGGIEFTLGFEQEAESGDDVPLSFEVSNEGDFASQCTPALQLGNTGNFQNRPGFGQFGSLSDDFEADGIEFVAAPELGI